MLFRSLPVLRLPVLERFAPVVLAAALGIVVMQRLPLRARFLHVVRFESVAHRLLHEVQLAVHPVAFVVRVRPQLGARHGSDLLVAMSFAHRRPFPGPRGVPSGSLAGKVHPKTSRVKSVEKYGRQGATRIVRITPVSAPFGTTV